MPSTSEQYRRDWNRRRNLPPWPTQHLPGTEAKMLVMMHRLEEGFHLHHPQDARFLEEFLDASPRCLRSRSGQRVLKVAQEAR